jgi:hypothetical protein
VDVSTAAILGAVDLDRVEIGRTAAAIWTTDDRRPGRRRLV